MDSFLLVFAAGSASFATAFCFLATLAASAFARSFAATFTQRTSTACAFSSGSSFTSPLYNLWESSDFIQVSWERFAYDGRSVHVSDQRMVYMVC